MRRTLTFILGVALGTTAAGAQEETWRAAKPAGEPVDCVQIAQIRETRVRDDRTIDFYMRSGEVYRNTLPIACPRLGLEERFTYRTSINRLCGVDTITVLTLAAPMRAAPCGLGKFQPIEVPA